MLINDTASSIEVSRTSIYRFDARNDLVNRISYGDMPVEMKALAASLGAFAAQGPG